MRKLNTIIVLLIMLLFIDHITFGSLHFLGTKFGITAPFAMTMFVLVLIHAIISIIITIKAEVVGFKTKARYNKENRQFWQRRASGIAILVLASMHVFLMQKGENGIPKIARMPKVFNLLLPLLLLSVGIHISQNIRPLLISLGIKNREKKEKIIKLLIILFTILVIIAYGIFVVGKIKGGH